MEEIICPLKNCIEEAPMELQWMIEGSKETETERERGDKAGGRVAENSGGY